MLSTLAISLSELTIQAAIVLGIAVFLLLVASWRRTQRGQRRSLVGGNSPDTHVAIVRIEPPRYKRPNPIRRLLALALSGGMGILIGAVLAIVVAYAAALIVSQLTSMLR